MTENEIKINVIYEGIGVFSFPFFSYKYEYMQQNYQHGDGVPI